MTVRRQQARSLDIADAYWDIEGNYHLISDSTLDYFIQALSTSPTQPADFTEVYVLLAEHPKLLFFPSIVHTYCLQDEQQQTLKADENVFISQWVCPPLSVGYYTLVAQTDAGEQRYRLIVAPPTCYHPDSLRERQLRGLMLQLYSLRSEAHRTGVSANWGIGDFADLWDCVDLAAEQGFDFIGLNPLHALYPAQPQWFSPYSPSSRIYWHWIYLSLGLIPEFTDNSAHLEWFERQGEALEALRQQPLVDYSQVAALKMQALRMAFSHFEQAGDAQRRADFQAFLEQGGQALQRNSAFYALTEVYGGDDKPLGSHVFPDALQSADSAEVRAFIADNVDNIRFYSYLQWLIDQQLAQVQQHCQQRQLALGLYGDLAVGVADGSADSWANPALYSLPASIGAPPDPLGPAGQDWGLPPMHPLVLKKQGFQTIIDILRANMKHCGVLRIDHVMGLYRLWLIPDGKPISEGAYIHYPFDTLMAILAIESQRAQCLLIGEDLGTVPNEVREALKRYQVLSYDVLYFAGREEQQLRWRSPKNVNQQALGVLGTHDLPPLAGWWHCCDLHLLRELGVLSEAVLKPLFDARLQDKQALLNALKWEGYLPDNYAIDAMKMAMHPRLNQALHAYVRDGNTQLLGIQPENFCGQEQAFNVPGTTSEAPNWQRKLPRALSAIEMTF